jgi:hypothetical protein
MVTAFKDAFLVMTAVALVGAVLAWFLQDRTLLEWRERGHSESVPDTASPTVAAGEMSTASEAER